MGLRQGQRTLAGFNFFEESDTEGTEELHRGHEREKGKSQNGGIGIQRNEELFDGKRKYADDDVERQGRRQQNGNGSGGRVWDRGERKKAESGKYPASET